MAPRSGITVVACVLFSLLTLPSVPAMAAPSAPVTFTILHTNDFHGQLEPSGSNPGAARVAAAVNAVRTAVGADNALLLDAGDIMQGSLLSNLQRGAPTVDYYRTIGYDAATLGNHEFDCGQTVLGDRIAQAEGPAGGSATPVQMVAANITRKDLGGNCTWEPLHASVTPYEVFTVGTAPNTVRVGVIGVGSVETPSITVASATAGLCFRDPAESILHYYDDVRTDADVIVVLSHLGYTDGGYDYGLPVYGDQTLAARLNTAGKPVDLIVGGHSHTNLTSATRVGSTTIVQAYYDGRRIGRADVTVDAAGAVDVAWNSLTVSTSDAQDPVIQSLVSAYVSDPAYQALINQPIGYVQTDLLRNYSGDSMMGDFVDDAIYYQLNGDSDPANDVDVFFNNAGGIRTDWCDAPDPVHPGQYIWSSNAADCSTSGVWDHDPMLLTYGQMFTILPFGNATVVGDMTGAQILDLLNQSATLFKGALHPAGLRYSFFRYSDALPGPQPWGWGAYDVFVIDRDTGDCATLEMDRTYRVGTNEFLAPAGQDGFLPFKYMTNITYWGDMLNAVNAWVAANYTFEDPYRGPDDDGTLDGRIARDGTDAGGSIVPITVLHHNDSHGNLVKGTAVGYTQLAAKIQQERAHNPSRTLLLNAGDSFQGDPMMYYFRSSYTGFAADGTALAPELQINPLLKAFNSVGYDAMTLGNHEFNFGQDVFTGALTQADFPILQANLEDDGRYGIDLVPVADYVEKTVGPEGIKLAILGIGNHRVPSYELPTNIEGLTFTDPIAKAQELSDTLRPDNDVVLALTHIGFKDNPGSVEVDSNVDTYMAPNVTGLDLIVGGHSHTNPATGFGAYKFLPTFVGGPDNAPVLVNQAYRYNNTLGELVLGMRPAAGGGYEVASRAGRYLAIAPTDPEDPALVAMAQPYVDLLAAYNDTPIGQTTAPIDALQAFTQETNAANLQADAAAWDLEANGDSVDFFLSGAMTNRKIADGATEAAPVTLKVSNLFTLMPYENSLVVLEMNGPQIRAVLERAYRNYYYYKYVPGYGGYSYYTTCMLDISAGCQITYNDLYPAAYDPEKEYVVSLMFDSQEVDFDDTDTYYRVATINYLAAGSCNFNEGGVTLWPLGQTVADTQLYTRDSVIDYVHAMGTVSPAIEGRLQFIYDVDPPLITINSPLDGAVYPHPEFLTLDFSAEDVGPAGMKKVWADLDGGAATDGQILDLLTLALGDHTLTVYAEDKAGNQASASATFAVTATTESLADTLDRFYDEGKIDNKGIYNSLLQKLQQAEKAIAKGKISAAISLLNALIKEAQAQSGKHITSEAAAILITDAQWIIAHLP